MKGGLHSAVATMAFLLTIVFVTNLPAYVLTWRIGIFPYHFFIGGSVLFLFSALLAGGFQKIPRANALLIGWFSLLNFLMLISLLLVSNIKVSQDAFVNIALFSIIAITFILMAKDPKILKACGTAVAISVSILVAVSFIEFLNPDFNIIDDVMFASKGTEGKVQRVGGLYENPNANGYAIALGMFVGQYFLPRNIRFIFAILAGFAVLTTVSRSAIMLWTLIIFCSIWTGAYSKHRVPAKIFAIFMTTGLATLLVTGQVPALIESAGLEQLVNKGMIERLSGDFLSQEDGSSASRRDLISQNIEIFTSNPIVGVGLGGSNSIEFDAQLGSHNMLLKMGVELGIIGILVYLSLLIVPLLAKSAQGTMFVIFYFFMNMFTHTSLEKPIFSILIPISILYFSSINLQKNKPKRKRKRRSRVTNNEALDRNQHAKPAL